MKKFILSLVVCIFAVGAASAQNWAVGARVGSGFQAQGEYALSDKNYVEARFGMGWYSAGAMLVADFTALYNWKVLTMDWTPSVGEWFFDAGVGVGVGGRANYAYVGAAGMAKLGLKFNDVPVKLSIDWTPVIGPYMVYGGGYTWTAFNAYGFANAGISCTYCF